MNSQHHKCRSNQAHLLTSDKQTNVVSKAKVPEGESEMPIYIKKCPYLQKNAHDILKSVRDGDNIFVCENVKKEMYGCTILK